MPRLRSGSPASSDAVLDDYASKGDSVPRVRRLSPAPQTIALGIGVGRLVLGGGFLAAPVASTRFLGLDTATAKRVSFLAQMAAARDIGLGVGTLNAGSGPAAAPWLAAGAVADAVDAVAIAGAIRSGVARGWPARGIVVGAAATAVIGLAAAIGLRRR